VGEVVAPMIDLGRAPRLGSHFARGPRRATSPSPVIPSHELRIAVQGCLPKPTMLVLAANQHAGLVGIP
jgi:hypothetical protein